MSVFGLLFKSEVSEVSSAYAVSEKVSGHKKICYGLLNGVRAVSAFWISVRSVSVRGGCVGTWYIRGVRTKGLSSFSVSLPCTYERYIRGDCVAFQYEEILCASVDRPSRVSKGTA